MKLHVLGHTAYDYIFDVPYHPGKGYSIYIKRYTRHYGGGGANICYGAAKLGIRCKLISSFGRDCRRYEKYLAKNGVELHVYRSKKRMARAFIFNADEQISYFFWGASEDMDKVEAIKSDYLHIAPSHPMAAIKMAEKAKFFAFEPGQDIPRYEKKDMEYLLENADIIFCNEYELRLLKKFGLKNKNVIVTLGKRGCMIYRRKKIIPAFKTKVIDATGAGDAFKAAFWAGWFRGYSMEDCCRIANKASSFIVRKRGSHHMPSWNKLVEEEK